MSQNTLIDKANGLFRAEMISLLEGKLLPYDFTIHTYWKPWLLLDDGTVMENEHELFNGTVHAHRFMLQFKSSYFEALLNTGLQEATQSEVTFEGIAKDTMEYILQFIYCGTYSTDWKFHEKVQLFIAADRLLLHEYADILLEDIISEIDANNALWLQQLNLIWPTRYKDDVQKVNKQRDISKVIRQVTLEHGQEMLHKKQFLELPLQVICSYLSDDQFSAVEDDIAKFMLRYLQHNHIADYDTQLQLLQLIRFDQIVNYDSVLATFLAHDDTQPLQIMLNLKENYMNTPTSESIVVVNDSSSSSDTKDTINKSSVMVVMSSSVTRTCRDAQYSLPSLGSSFDRKVHLSGEMQIYLHDCLWHDNEQQPLDLILPRMCNKITFWIQTNCMFELVFEYLDTLCNLYYRNDWQKVLTEVKNNSAGGGGGGGGGGMLDDQDDNVTNISNNNSKRLNSSTEYRWKSLANINVSPSERKVYHHITLDRIYFLRYIRLRAKSIDYYRNVCTCSYAHIDNLIIYFE